MIGSGDAETTPRSRPHAAAFSPSTATDELVAILWLAGLDAEMDRIPRSAVDDLEPLGRRRSDLAERRESLLARVSPPVRERYGAARRHGQQPAVAALRDDRCPGCGLTLPEASCRLVRESPRAVPCHGCLRLLYDRGWTDRDLKPPTLRPVATTEP